MELNVRVLFSGGKFNEGLVYICFGYREDRWYVGLYPLEKLESCGGGV